VGAVRGQKRLESQQKVFRKQSNDSLCYGAANLLAEESKPFSVREFIRKRLQYVVRDLSGKRNCLHAVSVICAAMKQRVEATSSDKQRVSKPSLCTG